MRKRPQFESSSSTLRFGSLAVTLIAFIALLGYAVHERNTAKRLLNENEQTATALKETRGEMGALNARLEVIEGTRQLGPPSVAHRVPHARATIVRLAKPDPRWNKFKCSWMLKARRSMLQSRIWSLPEPNFKVRSRKPTMRS